MSSHVCATLLVFYRLKVMFEDVFECVYIHMVILQMLRYSGAFNEFHRTNINSLHIFGEVLIQFLTVHV